MYRHQELPDMGEQAPRNTGYGMYRHQELPDIECTGTKKDQRWMNRQREREKRDEQAPGNTGYGWTGTKKYQIWVYRHQPVAINGNWKWPHLSFFYSVRYNSKEMIETHWFIYKRVWYILTKDLKCRHIKSQHEINKNIVVLRKKMKLWDGLGKKTIRKQLEHTVSY